MTKSNRSTGGPGMSTYPSILLTMFFVLQSFDVYITLACGGLRIEANPVVVHLWQTGGIAVLLLLKVAVGGLICIAWGIYDMMAVCKWPLSIVVVVGSAIPIGWNTGGLTW